MSMPQRFASALVASIVCLVAAPGDARAQAFNGLNGGVNAVGGFNNGFAVGGFNNGFGGGFAFSTPMVGGVGVGNGMNNFGGAVGFGAGPGFAGGYSAPVFNMQPTTYNNLNGLGMLIDQQVVQRRSSTLPAVRRRRR